MTDPHLARRLEKALADDARTHELGVRLTVAGDHLVVQGEVASDERRRAVLDVVHDLEPSIPVTDHLTISGEALDPPKGRERFG
jgi:hypothetical protein